VARTGDRQLGQRRFGFSHCYPVVSEYSAAPEAGTRGPKRRVRIGR